MHYCCKGGHADDWPAGAVRPEVPLLASGVQVPSRAPGRDPEALSGL